MTISRPCYATRESVADALDISFTARRDRQIDDAIEAATVDVDDFCHRTFSPELGTRLFDWPTDSRSWRLWLDDRELIRLDSIISAGVALDTAGLKIYPAKGPPYNRLEIDLSTSEFFQQGTTRQQAIAITGLWGFQDTQTTAGTLTAAVNGTVTAVPVSDSSTIGVGDLLQVGDERMLVTGRRQADTGQTLTADLSASTGAVTAHVADGTAFAPGETVTVDGERLRVDDITGNLLIVRRQWDSSTLAAHTTSTALYAPRLLQVVRGQAGTVAASHTEDDPIRRHAVPGPVARYVRAAAGVTVLQELAGYARTVGAGDQERQASGTVLQKLRDELEASYGRTRIRAV